MNEEKLEKIIGLLETIAESAGASVPDVSGIELGLSHAVEELKKLREEVEKIRIDMDKVRNSAGKIEEKYRWARPGR